MPLFLNRLEKLIFKNFNLAPAPMLDLIGGFSFYIVSSAIKLNIFEALKNGGIPADTLAVDINADPVGLNILLECLESLGYVRRKKNNYYLTKMTEKWLLNSSEAGFKSGFEYYHSTMIELWPYINESVKAGKEHINFYDWLKDKPETGGTYQKFMMSLAVLSIPELLKSISLKNEKILDIGGSHGLYSIALCGKYKGIDVTIIDSEYSMALLNKNIETAGLADRIHTVVADFVTDSVDESFDIILLFNVLHEHKEKYNLEIIRKIYSQLNSGGRIIILESIKEKKFSPAAEFGLKVYSLLFFHFLGGQNYAFNEISRWLGECGFKKIKRKKMLRSGFSIIEGWK